MVFTYSRSLTVDHTKCGASDSSSFPVLVSASDATLKDAAHSGHVQSATGADILFFSDSALTTQIASEIDFYDNVNGILTAWVQVPTVSHTVDTVIYIAYGNASPPARTTNPWDANYKGVWHLPDGTTYSGADSVSGGHAMASAGGVTAVVGKVDGGGGFGAANGYAKTAASFQLGATNTVTLTAWCKAVNVTSRYTVFATSDGNLNFNWSLELGNPNGLQGSVSAIIPGNFIFQTGSATYPSDGAWHHVAFTRNGTGNTAAIYIDGVSKAVTATGVVDFTDTSAPKLIGVRTSPSTQIFNGSLDEVKVSSVARSADWITTEYNNQNAPGNIGTPGFLTWGSESVSGTQQQFSMLGCGS